MLRIMARTAVGGAGGLHRRRGGMRFRALMARRAADVRRPLCQPWQCGRMAAALDHF